MSGALAERREEMLGLLAEKTLALACAVQQRALEAEGSDEMARLSVAFVKLGRCVRQSIALHAKLEGERLKPEAAPAPQSTPAAAPAADEPDDPREQAVGKRRALITRAIERCMWDEYDQSDEDEEETGVSLLRDFDERLADFAADDAFLDADPDRLIAQFCVELGLTPPEPRPRATLAAAMPPCSAPPGADTADAPSPAPSSHTVHSPDSS